MYAVIFEVEFEPGAREEYLRLAGELKEHLAGFEGFVSVERFASLSTQGKILSLSLWEDEAAIARWRDFADHRAAQSRGRDALFSRYRIRVASVVRDYGSDTDR